MLPASQTLYIFLLVVVQEMRCFWWMVFKRARADIPFWEEKAD